MEHLNPVDQARQLAAEVVKRLGQLNLHRRELERKLHVRRIEFYRYVNPPLSREAERELGEWKGKVREIMGML